ncbi:hypothetical protein A8H31_12680 [Burkholderia thailandensis]|nr:hypothetical protein A8H31_12680 [Burkholderia thailandensis]NOK45188.1 hypothetical protein [Burkholderia thailandensis]NOK54750.1 hypothetical protein [Burkholderia thailandensis]PNE72308.1 hypothetical protein A8H38_09635 [Burkholderia thailandensis]PNE83841.1 hypothetical protein A8H34_06785 [Burkholderia thailandensis]
MNGAIARRTRISKFFQKCLDRTGRGAYCRGRSSQEVRLKSITPPARNSLPSPSLMLPSRLLHA